MIGRCCESSSGPHREVYGRTTVMYGHGNSDSLVVPTKFANKDAEKLSAERDGGKETDQGEQGYAKHGMGLSAQETVPSACGRGQGRNFEADHLVCPFCSALLSPEVGAVCISSARTDLWRGRLARAVPTPTAEDSK